MRAVEAGEAAAEAQPPVVPPPGCVPTSAAAQTETSEAVPRRKATSGGCLVRPERAGGREQQALARAFERDVDAVALHDADPLPEDEHGSLRRRVVHDSSLEPLVERQGLRDLQVRTARRRLADPSAAGKAVVQRDA